MIAQDEPIIINLLSGVDDEAAFLSVEDTSEVPDALKADLDATSNGVLTFTPHPDFWGVYRATFSVEDAGENIVSADISIIVIPQKIDLSLVESGHGGFIVDGEMDDQLGTAITGTDFDGDGLNDVVIGAPGAATDAAGRVIVVRGAATPTDVALPSDLNAVHVLAGTNGRGAGTSLAQGDLNGDGFFDLVIGSTRLMDTGAGRVYAIFGGESYRSPALVDLTDDMGDVGYTISGANGVTGVGLRVAVGSLGGNARPDVLAMTSSPPGAASVDAFFSPGTNEEVTASDLHFEGHSSTTIRLLPSMALVGDLVGDDGHSELFIASSQGFILLNSGSSGGWPSDMSMPLTADQGWQGGSAGLNLERRVAAAGNFEETEGRDLAHCDGVSACLIVPFSDSPDFLDEGWPVIGFAGIPRVFGAGNLNNDSFDDLLFTDGSAAYVIWGRSTLPSTDLNVTDVDEDGVTILPTSADPITHLAMLGDVNGDGVGDLGIGVPAFDGGRGRVYVVFGTPASAD